MQDILYLIVLSFMLNIRQIKHHLHKYGSDILPCIIMLALYMYICIRVCTHFIFIIIIKYATTILSCCMITPPRFLHSPMITRNIRRSDHVTKNSLIMTEWHRSPTNCNVHVSLQITLNISREFSLQMVNSGLLNRLTNCKNLAFTCPLTPKQAPERQIVFMSFVFCLH